MRHLFPLMSQLWLVPLLGVAIPGTAQIQHITPFTGTWKLKLEKSRFNPGPPFQSFTLTFAPDGARHLDLVHADGRNLKAALPWSDGKEVHVKANLGQKNITAVSRIKGKAFRDTWRDGGKIIEKVHGALFSDGKALSITVDGTDGQGHSYQNQLTFEKQ